MSLKVIGSNAETTIVDGGTVDTVVKILKQNAHVTLSRLIIRGGVQSDQNYGGGGGVTNYGTVMIDNCIIRENTGNAGGGVGNSGTAWISNTIITGNNGGETGGGIWNYGKLTISHSSVSGNSVTAEYCGVIGAHCSGGGIHNEGSLTINDSDVSANIVRPGKVVGDGGGIFSADFGATPPTLTINRSTISNNVATGSGGGIFAGYLTTMTINDSTINGNGGGGGIATEATAAINNSTITGNGGGILNFDGTTTLQNSIVANNSAENCNGTILSNGYNLSSDGTCNFSSLGDLNNTDPKLGPLQNNGGPTQTQALLTGSPAIDAGNPNGCTDGNGHLLKTDQRGAPRPDKEDTGGCDMGAYEFQNPSLLNS